MIKIKVANVTNKRKIKALLTEHDMSQLELAKILNMSVVTVNAKVNNIDKFKLSELYALSNAFNMSIVDLIKYIES